MNAAFIVDAVRTPIGKYGGMLASVRPDDLASFVIRKLFERNQQVSKDQVEDVILGAANQAGEDNRNVARMASLLAGLPVEVGGVTVNRLCASGLQAIMDAARAIQLNEGEVYIAGGVESMSRAPFVVAKSEEAYSRKTEMYDTTLGWRFVNKALAKIYHPFSMGETAENVAEKFKISRVDQDAFALSSQTKYKAAAEAARFDGELIPFEIEDPRSGSRVVHKDEQPRETTLEKLSTLRPAFREGGSVTAGNSSGINDGAAAALMVSEKALKTQSIEPLGRVVAMAIAGVDPAFMGIGPVPASQKALKRAGLRMADIGLVELNEAFASQSLACVRELDIDPSIVNVNGGAIAIGHPLGCSGVRISAALLHEMKRRGIRYGLATMCVGVGQGAAIIYEGS
jgi:3-oxoadipyl-CoA thiolase